MIIRHVTSAIYQQGRVQLPAGESVCSRERRASLREGIKMDTNNCTMMGNNMTNSTCTNNCDVFDTWPYITVALISAGTAFVSVVACALVIALILLLKKHYFYTQRLILYLSIAAFLNSLAIFFRLERIGYKEEDTVPLKVVCIFTAAFDHITAWSELIAICCITFNLFLNAVFHKQTERLEKLYFILIFIFPLTFNWIPFLHLSYGQAGAWCWIRSTNDDDCSKFVFGIFLQFALWYIPLYVILIILILVYILIIYKVRRQRHHWEGKHDPETERLKKQVQNEVKPLLWYPLIYFVLNIFPLMNRIYDTFDTDPLLALWLLHAIFSPLQGGFIAVAYTFDSETRQRLNCARLRAAVTRSDPHISEYPVTEGHTDSFRASNETAANSTADLVRPSTGTIVEVRGGTHTYDGIGTTTQQ